MCRYLTQFESEGTPKGIAIKMSIISVTYYFRFCSLKFFFKTTRTILSKSDRLVPILVADLKHFSLFDINRSTHEELFMLLKQVFSFTIFFASWEFRNSDNTVSISSLLKSPAERN